MYLINFTLRWLSNTIIATLTGFVDNTGSSLKSAPYLFMSSWLTRISKKLLLVFAIFDSKEVYNL